MKPLKFANWGIAWGIIFFISTSCANINATINRFILKAEHYYPHAAIAGVLIKSLNSGKVLYQKNADRLFAPASTLKIITASTALIFLKPNFRFETQVLEKGNISHGTLVGDLTIKFGGDPELTTDELKLMLQQLGKLGINHIKGHIYIDNSDYDDVGYAPGWIWDDLSYSYGAPVNAIIIDHNKFGLHFIPQKLNQPPKLNVDLPVNIIKITNHLHTVKRLPYNCPIAIYSAADNHYTISGCLLRRSGEQRRSLAIRDVKVYAQHLIAKILTDNNISFSAPIRIHKTPPHSKQVAIYYSPPLSTIIKEMLKDSDNLTTNAIFKKIGERYYNRQATWETSLHAVKHILKHQVHLNFRHNLIAGGAGMSRYNLIKPELLVKLLSYDYKHPTIRRPLLNALPTAGVDGTLKYRMHAAARQHRISAKTGTMTGVSALAGYIQSKHNGPIVFAIMFNNFVGSVRRYTHYQDKICLYIMNATKVNHG